ncbi:MAG: hypothetical protein AAFU71_00035 [Cyanobacteria bacterium J06632_22]
MAVRPEANWTDLDWAGRRGAGAGVWGRYLGPVSGTGIWDRYLGLHDRGLWLAQTGHVSAEVAPAQ